MTPLASCKVEAHSCGMNDSRITLLPTMMSEIITLRGLEKISEPLALEVRSFKNENSSVTSEISRLQYVKHMNYKSGL